MKYISCRTILYIRKDANEIHRETYAKWRIPMQFDNHDERIKYYELLLQRELAGIPVYPLPDGYRFVFYRPGDRDIWIDIETSAREFTGYDQGLASWNRYYQGKDEELVHRMVFIENESGERVATATAFYNIYKEDPDGAGWLHWVAVRRDYQGLGLSKPLITHVLGIMVSLGYTKAKIPTQTNTWLACKVYLDLGFRPIPANAYHSREGWQIIKTLTHHPALEEFTEISPADILGQQIP